MRQTFAIVVLMIMVGCSAMSTPVSPSGVVLPGTSLRIEHPYTPFASHMLRTEAPEAPGTIGFFWPEDVGAWLHFKLASVDSKETYAEAWVQADPWSPETASLTILRAFCEQTLRAQLDVLRYLIDANTGKPGALITPADWRNPHYTGNGHVWTLTGPSCEPPPPPPPPPPCQGVEITIVEGEWEIDPVQPVTVQRTCPLVRYRRPVSRNSCTGAITYVTDFFSTCPE